VEYLESYVALQKLRFGRDVKIAFHKELPENEKHNTIEPMLLIPFVENAFKHGTGYVNEPFIDISLTMNKSILAFEVKNRFDLSEKSKDGSSGIGLNNVRSRLTLLYPARHKLFIDKDKSLFRINLSLTLL
jgi:sensor histidine kinase YesM